MNNTILLRQLYVFARGAIVGDIFMLHEEEYGVKPEVVVSAPGSVNLLGEHTDYNEGWILQAAIDKTATVAISKRTDNSLRFYAADFSERKRTTIANLKYKREDRWANISKGVVSEIIHLGFSFKGMDITISSEIPFGIGLASSAAIAVATAVAISNLYNLNLQDMQIIKSAQLAEKVFMKKEVSLADQFVACLAKPDTAIYLDLRTLEYEYIPMNFGEDYFLITNSNVPKVSAEAELNERVLACRECVEHLKNKKDGTTLRDYTAEDLKTGIGLVPENIRRLCMHVVEENQKVLEGKAFLKSKDFVSFGKLMNRSHESLRDSFEVSCPEIDWLVKRSWEIEGIYGSRLTGSGFGGCTISLVNDASIDLYKERLDEYEHIFGFDADLIPCVPSGGVEISFSK